MGIVSQFTVKHFYFHLWNYRGCNKITIKASLYPSGSYERHTGTYDLQDARNKDCFSIPMNNYYFGYTYAQYLQFNVDSYYGESASLQYLELNAAKFGRCK